MHPLTAETCLLGVVTDEFKAFGFILDDIGGDRWVMGYLFNEESGTATTVHIGPIAIEKPGIR